VEGDAELLQGVEDELERTDSRTQAEELRGVLAVIRHGGVCVCTPDVPCQHQLASSINLVGLMVDDDIHPDGYVHW
jgi:acetolactate synthase regulatory subunit